MVNGSGARAGRLMVGYYLATPVFAVADLGFGAPVRVADVLPTGPRAAYYAAVFVLGLLCARYPGAVGWVGMGESATNLLILLLSILLPIWSMVDAVSLGTTPQGSLLDGAGIVNAVLSGTAMVVSFHRHQAAVLGRGTPPRPPHGV